MTAPRINRRLITILLIVFVNMLGSAMILPILPLYALDTFKLPEWQISLIISSFFIAQFFAGPVLGRLSDRIGRLPVLIVSQIGTIGSFLMMGLANTAWLLLVARVIDGITGGNIIVAQAYLTDVTPREKRTETLGYIFAVFGLGFVLGPAIGGELSARFGPRVPFYIASAFAGLTLLLTIFFLDESLSPEQQSASKTNTSRSLAFESVIRNRRLVQILVISFFAQFALGLLQSTYTLWGNAVLFPNLPEAVVVRRIGFLFATIGLTQVITQSAVLPRLLKRIAEPVIVFSGNIIRIIATLIFSVTTTVPPAVVASIVMPFGLGIMMPPLQSMTTHTVEDELRGGVLGIYQSVVSLAIILGTGIGGALFTIAPAVPFWVATGAGLLATVPSIYLLRNPPPAGEPALRVPG